MLVYLVLITLISPPSIHGIFAQTWSWGEMAAGEGYFDWAHAIARDGSGNILVGGRIADTVVFDSDTLGYNNTNGGRTFFLAKYDSLRHSLWVIGSDTGTSSIIIDIVTDADDNIYVIGNFRSVFTLGGDTIQVSGSQSNGFVAKVSPSGQLIWQRHFDNSQSTLFNDIEIRNDRIYLVGKVRGLVTLDTLVLSQNSAQTQGFLIAMDTAGNAIWSSSFGAGQRTEAVCLELATNGDFFLAGVNQEALAIGNDSLKAGSENFTLNRWIIRMDSGGQPIWARNAGEHQFFSEPRYMDLAVDLQNRVFLTSLFEDTITIGGDTLIASAGEDVYVVAFSGQGVQEWSKSLSGPGNERVHDLICDASSNVHIAGYASNPFFTGDSTFTVSFDEGYVLTLDALGNTVGFISMGGSISSALDLYRDTEGGLLLAGYVYTSVFLGPDTLMSSWSGGEVLFARIEPKDCPHIEPTVSAFSGGSCDSSYKLLIAPVGFDEYHWSSGEYTDSIQVHSSGSYYLVVTDSNGCTGVSAYMAVHLQMDTLNIHSNGPLSLCFGDSVALTASPGFNSHTWSTGSNDSMAVGFSGDTVWLMALKDSCLFSDTLYIEELDISYAADSQTVCDSYTWPVNNSTYTSSGNFNDTLINGNGCDSIVTLDLTILHTTFSSNTMTACDSLTWMNGATYYSSNSTAADTLINAAGCDSIITLNLTILNATTGLDVVTACNAYTWIDGNTYTASNSSATDTLINSAGCDSIVTLSLTILNTSTGLDEVTACDAYTWIDGNTYTASNNTATDTLVNASGCDSVVTLDLTILNATATTDVISTCDSYTWIDGVTYTSTNNTATDTLVNASGCDSVVTLDLTILNATATTDVISACDSYTWIDGVTYTSTNNTATDTLVNASGCDSVVTLDLTILNATAITDVISACDSYTWIDGVTYTSSNNTALVILANAAGCDSLVTLDLTINSVDTSVAVTGFSLTSNAIGANYQWLYCDSISPIANATSQSYLATENGFYAVEATKEGCVDTSTCIEIVGVGLLEAKWGSEIRVYPNPTTHKVNIDLGDLQGIDITVHNLKGQLLSIGPSKASGLVDLDVGTLSQGTYLIRMMGDHHLRQTRLIKL